MSFVIGMATGYETRKLVEERSLRRQILQYIESTGIKLTDRTGRLISPDEFFSQVLGYHPQRCTWIMSLVAAVVLAGIALTTVLMLWQLI